MPFPESPRVLYEKNPLFEVICQVRFPTILRIDSEPPTAFQEKIRTIYPLLEKRSSLALDLPPEIIGPLEVKINATQSAYDFGSADEMWKVSLNSGSLSLITKDYRRWEEFRSKLLPPLDALVNEYRPAFYSRIGLRYKNLIRRSTIGLPINTPWADLLRAEVAGVLTDPVVGAAVDGALGVEVVRLNESGGQVRIQHGLVLSQDSEPELCYLIDSDFSVEGKVQTPNAIQILNDFNAFAARLFRWCISDQLYESLGPAPI